MNKWVKFGLMLGVSAACCYAQSTSIGVAAQGVANEMVAIARWVGIILLIICGLACMAGGTHMAGKIGGAILGLIIALSAPSLVAWIQSHGAS